MSDDQANLLDAVDEAARLAGATALAHFNSALRVERKDDGSPVTVADRAAEERVVEWISRRFPNDGVVGEEFGELRPGARRRWIIDPIDGTKSFIRGVPLWGSLVAVVEGTDILAGAAAFPAVDEFLCAARGGGAWHNGTRCITSTVSALADATVLTTEPEFPANPERREGWNRLVRQAGVVRSWGDCYGYLLVATGRAEVMVDAVLADWDAAALYPIITEAGGVFTDYTGQPTAFGRSAIATNAGVASAARQLLGATTP